MKVTSVSFAAVEPGTTKTIAVRLGKSVSTNLLLGLVVTLVTSVAGSLWSSTMRTAPAGDVIGPEQRPPRTEIGVPPLTEYWKSLPLIPLVVALQISIFPVPVSQGRVFSVRTPSRSKPSATIGVLAYGPRGVASTSFTKLAIGTLAGIATEPSFVTVPANT